MKAIFFLLIGIVIGYFWGHSKSGIQVTYNAIGNKVVVATSDSIRNATISVGQECGEDGYTSIGKGMEDSYAVVTAECNKREDDK